MGPLWRPIGGAHRINGGKAREKASVGRASGTIHTRVRATANAANSDTGETPRRGLIMSANTAVNEGGCAMSGRNSTLGHVRNWERQETGGGVTPHPDDITVS